MSKRTVLRVSRTGRKTPGLPLSLSTATSRTTNRSSLFSLICRRLRPRTSLAASCSKLAFHPMWTMGWFDHHGANSKAVIWAHNSHIGDASATEMSRRGEYNIGQLCREYFAEDSYHIGFGTNDGTVAAASSWDGPMQIMPVRPAHPLSVMSGCFISRMHLAYSCPSGMERRTKFTKNS